MIRSGIWLLRCLMILCLLATPVMAQLGGSAGADKAATATKPEIDLSLVDPDEPVVIWRDVRVQCSVLIGNLPQGIGVRKVTLSVPAVLAVESSDGKNEVSLISEATTLREGDRRDYRPVELKAKKLKFMWGQLWRVLTFRPRKEVFLATLEYQRLSDQQIETSTKELAVNVKATPIGMYTGALIGALLSALLVVLQPLRSILSKKGTKDTTPKVSGRTIANQMAIRFAIGAVATLIAILLFQTTTDIKFPVAISVQDFYGGVLLGLFGNKVMEVIWKRVGP